MTSYLRIAESGWSTTLQDLGRPGFQRMGVSVSGALDSVSLQAANVLVGNARNAAAIEVCYLGPTLVAETDSVRVAVVGGTARLEVLPYAAAALGRAASANQSFRLSRSEALRIGPLKAGSVLYVAVEGGFDIRPVLGSLSTDVRCSLGGWNGRTLEAGDYLPLRLDRAVDRLELKITQGERKHSAPIRIMLGPQSDYFSDDEIDRFLGETFTVSSESNRMGMRLNGPRIQHLKGFNIVSDALTFGSIQIMGNGQPIVMMPDRPTTGGYPKIATVISADLHRIGRMSIGSHVTFAAVSAKAAEDARRDFLEELKGFLRVSRVNDFHLRGLLETNLISGFVNATSDDI